MALCWPSPGSRPVWQFRALSWQFRFPRRRLLVGQSWENTAIAEKGGARRVGRARFTAVRQGEPGRATAPTGHARFQYVPRGEGPALRPLRALSAAAPAARRRSPAAHRRACAGHSPGAGGKRRQDRQQGGDHLPRLAAHLRRGNQPSRAHLRAAPRAGNLPGSAPLHRQRAPARLQLRRLRRAGEQRRRAAVALSQRTAGAPDPHRRPRPADRGYAAQGRLAPADLHRRSRRGRQDHGGVARRPAVARALPRRRALHRPVDAGDGRATAVEGRHRAGPRDRRG